MGYSPVQYDIVVAISGVGKMKLTAVSPYDITFVIRPRKETGDVPFVAKGGRVLVTDIAAVVENVVDD